MIIDLFAGPGGADLGIRTVTSERVVGVEWDTAACQTREAAGLETVQADVAQLDPADYAGAWGLWASPPCQDFSMAGRRAGIDGDRGMLIHEVMRWARIIEPAWIACEQVPPALPVWELFAHELRTMGYRAWAGVLNAADYGVPQTRKRAILMASRERFDLPEPTHAKDPQPAGLFGGELLPWVTMADALGWDGHVWTNSDNNLDDKTYVVDTSQPAPTATSRVNRWLLHTNGGQEEDGSRQTVDPAEHPAPTVFFGGRLNDVSWVYERPATTVVGSFSPETIAAPGWRTSDDGPRQNAPGSVRVTVEQAAVLQGFPPDHPWQGSKTARFRQVGDAVPPPVAAAVVAPLLDANEREVAA